MDPPRGRGESPDGRGKLTRSRSISAGRIKTGLATWSSEDLARLIERLAHYPQYKTIARKIREDDLGGSLFSDDDGATTCVRMIEAETREDLTGVKLKKLVNLFRELRMDPDKEAAHHSSVSDDALACGASDGMASPMPPSPGAPPSPPPPLSVIGGGKEGGRAAEEDRVELHEFRESVSAAQSPARSAIQAEAETRSGKHKLELENTADSEAGRTSVGESKSEVCIKSLQPPPPPLGGTK